MENNVMDVIGRNSAKVIALKTPDMNVGTKPSLALLSTSSQGASQMLNPTPGPSQPLTTFPLSSSTSQQILDASFLYMDDISTGN
jgi:hypothetical protein